MKFEDLSAELLPDLRINGCKQVETDKHYLHFLSTVTYLHF
jgi:hypothetical protein